MFQNVREKHSLAYTIRSSYIRQKGNIYIKAGIEIEKEEQAIKLIKEQLESMKNGDFTSKDVEDAKKYVLSGIQTIKDEQDSEVIYHVGQELSRKLY